jgi:hypothetical protein
LVFLPSVGLAWLYLPEPEPDVYTHELIEWSKRHVYVIDEVMGEFGPFESFWHLLQAAQEQTLRAVMAATARALELVDEEG